MIIYLYVKTHRTTGLKYLGKTKSLDPHKYPGSGVYWTRHLKEHGFDISTEILKECHSHEEIKEWGAYYSNLWNIVESKDWANLMPEVGDGGFVGSTKWFHSLSQSEKDAFHARQAEKRTKGWYVSRVDDPTETYVQNISKWCEEHGVDKSMPTGLNDPNSRLFQKQTKGWRIRRADMPTLPPYQNNRNLPRPNTACKGKSWKLVNNKRVWSDK